jgi:hypothetical protein
MQAFQGTNDVLTLLTDTIAGFLDVRADLQYYNLDALPSSDEESDDTATEESPIPTGHVHDNIYTLFLNHDLSHLNTSCGTRQDICRFLHQAIVLLS